MGGGRTRIKAMGEPTGVRRAMLRIPKKIRNIYLQTGADYMVAQCQRDEGMECSNINNKGLTHYSHNNK
jgi:hypothetical protein